LRRHASSRVTGWGVEPWRRDEVSAEGQSQSSELEKLAAGVADALVEMEARRLAEGQGPMSETEKMLTGMREMSKDPQYRLSIALHEAAHVLYGLRAGFAGATYHGPHESPGQPGVFGQAGVALNAPLTKINLRAAARWLCAGSVVKHALLPRYWDEEVVLSDYEMYVGYAAAAGATQEQTSELWEIAKQDVERDLRSPAFRRELWARARDVESKIPW
jgi:hypothetical protein